VHEADALGRLAVTDAGLLRRELLVLDTVLGEGIPLAGYVGGGYDDDLEVGVGWMPGAGCGGEGDEVVGGVEGRRALHGPQGSCRPSCPPPAPPRAAPQVLAARHCALFEAGLRMFRDHGL
jgi:hypothetical protein